jgi:hypothetical protein
VAYQQFRRTDPSTRSFAEALKIAVATRNNMASPSRR